jgi:hypothetical protein
MLRAHLLGLFLNACKKLLPSHPAPREMFYSQKKKTKEKKANSACFTQCAAYYEANTPVTPLAPGWIVLIVIGSLFVAGLCAFSCTLIHKERQGQPVFGISMDESKPLTKESNPSATRPQVEDVVAI